MSDELSAAEVETLKERFRAAGCAVYDLDGAAFEIVGSDFPVLTHVSVNPYYVQLATYIFATPHGFLPGRRSKLHAYLSDINRNAKLAKFTLEREAPTAPKGTWPIFASVKLVTGGCRRRLRCGRHQKFSPAVVSGHRGADCISREFRVANDDEGGAE